MSLRKMNNNVFIKHQKSLCLELPSICKFKVLYYKFKNLFFQLINAKMSKLGKLSFEHLPYCLSFINKNLDLLLSRLTPTNDLKYKTLYC